MNVCDCSVCLAGYPTLCRSVLGEGQLLPPVRPVASRAVGAAMPGTWAGYYRLVTLDTMEVMERIMPSKPDYLRREWWRTLNFIRTLPETP